MTLFTVIRHGETEWNLIGRQQGHLDSSLTLRGEEQAEMAALALKDHHYDVFYSSDTGRAMQTAWIISSISGISPIIPEPGLREQHMGILQGLTLKQFRKTYPDEYTRFMNNDPEYNYEIGESRRERYDRNIHTLNKIATEYNDSNVLIVGHGGLLDSIIRYIFEMPLNEKRTFSLYNGGIHRFECNKGTWRLLSWGDICHLTVTGSIDDQ
ncbi:MAG: histidine phosphatase family protein [Spirochaetota bacterium]